MVRKFKVYHMTTRYTMCCEMVTTSIPSQSDSVLSTFQVHAVSHLPVPSPVLFTAVPTSPGPTLPGTTGSVCPLAHFTHFLPTPRPGSH